MDDETLDEEHTKACQYLAKICRDLLQKSVQEILNRLVSFETNIWACIYRIMDKYQLKNSDNSTRGKSPAYSIRDS